MCQDKTQTFSMEENSFPRFGLGRRMGIRPRGDISLLVIFTLSGAAGRYDIVINSVPGFAVRDCILRVVLNQGCGNRNALRPRGPFLFRSAGKGSKRGRSDRRDGRLCTALRQPFACKPRWNPFGEAPQTHCACVASACSRRFKHMGSFPHRATQSDSAGAALAYRKL